MKIRRYVAKDMRSALAQIKDELGVDAVIMSNKKIAEGVELMAAVDYNQNIKPAQSTSQRGQLNLEPSTSDNTQSASRVDIAEDTVAISSAPQQATQQT